MRCANVGSPDALDAVGSKRFQWGGKPSRDSIQREGHWNVCSVGHRDGSERTWRHTGTLTERPEQNCYRFMRTPPWQSGLIGLCVSSRSCLGSVRAAHRSPARKGSGLSSGQAPPQLCTLDMPDRRAISSTPMQLSRSSAPVGSPNGHAMAGMPPAGTILVMFSSCAAKMSHRRSRALGGGKPAGPDFLYASTRRLLVCSNRISAGHDQSRIGFSEKSCPHGQTAIGI